jgi:hypothetical protein
MSICVWNFFIVDAVTWEIILQHEISFVLFQIYKLELKIIFIKIDLKEMEDYLIFVMGTGT